MFDRSCSLALVCTRSWEIMRQVSCAGWTHVPLERRCRRRATSWIARNGPRRCRQMRLRGFANGHCSWLCPRNSVVCLRCTRVCDQACLPPCKRETTCSPSDHCCRMARARHCREGQAHAVAGRRRGKAQSISSSATMPGGSYNAIRLPPDSIVELSTVGVLQRWCCRYGMRPVPRRACSTAVICYKWARIPVAAHGRRKLPPVEPVNLEAEATLRLPRRAAAAVLDTDLEDALGKKRSAKGLVLAWLRKTELVFLRTLVVLKYPVEYVHAIIKSTHTVRYSTGSVKCVVVHAHARGAHPCPVHP